MASTIPLNASTWPKILGVCAFNLIVIWFLLARIDPDPRHRLSTMQVVTLGLVPLILFYLRNRWPALRWSVALLGIVVVTIFTYAFLHELSHVLALYAVGSRPLKVHLVPRYWAGEFTTGASVSSAPLDGWIGAIPGLGPYIKDVLFVAAGVWILRKGKIQSAFAAGLVYATFCLVPLFDLVNNYSIYVLLGEVPGNDFYGTSLRWGAGWTHAIGLAGSTLALAVSAWVLLFYTNHPAEPSAGGHGRGRRAA